MDALAEITPAATFIESRLRLGHLRKLMVLGLHFFYIKQAAPRPSEQAHGTRLALLLRLQRDNSLVIVYLGRCPRLYTVALSARVGYSYVAPIIMVEPVWAVPKFLVVGNTHGVACGKSAGCSCNRGSRPLRFPEPSLACWEPSLER